MIVIYTIHNYIELKKKKISGKILVLGMNLTLQTYFLNIMIVLMHKSKLSPYSDLIAKIKYKFYLLFYFLIFLNKELHDNFQVPLSIFFFLSADAQICVL